MSHMSRFAVLAACGFMAIPALANDVRYACEDGAQIHADFQNGAGAAAVLNFINSDRRMVLPQAPSADGGRYAGDGAEFWIKGRTARLTRGGNSVECVAR